MVAKDTKKAENPAKAEKAAAEMANTTATTALSPRVRATMKTLKRTPLPRTTSRTKGARKTPSQSANSVTS